MTKGYIALEDGRVFEGVSFGSEGKASAEVVFNTSMTGYQEILTDPSYTGQIITMTYPLIGNYGTNPQDVESRGIFCSGLIVREYCPYPSNFRNTQSLGDYLKENNIPGITEVDTRALTRHIRTAGAMRGIIAAGDYDPEELIAEAQNSPKLEGRDLVKDITTPEKYTFDEECYWMPPATAIRYSVAVYDYGVKRNILRCLSSLGCKVTVYPATTSAEEILQDNPDGIFLSNGPGDPQAVTYAIENVRKLIGKKPIMGICLGHQISALALGGQTYKLKFGHRGANHPVRDEATGKIEITSQNHGFSVDMESFPESIAEVTHINLNDMTVEGLKHRTEPLFSVQYHPESSAGPHDADYLFKRFITMMKENK